MAPRNSVLKKRLDGFLAAPSDWSLVGGLRLLEQALYPDTGLPPYPDRRFALVPAPDLAFPAADLRRSRMDGKRLLLEINALALSGPDAPLPHYLLAECDGAGRGPLSDLLAVFNHRLYTLMYQAERLDESGHPQAPVRQIAHAMRRDGGTAALPHLGDPGARSLEALKTVLARRWPDIRVRVKQVRPGAVRVGAAMLGDSASLGRDGLLGDHVQVAGRRVDLELSAARQGALARLLPGEREWPELVRHLSSLVPMEVDCRLLFLRRSPPHDGWTLGGAGHALGRETPLGRSPTGHYTLPVRPGRHPDRVSCMDASRYRADQSPSSRAA